MNSIDDNPIFSLSAATGISMRTIQKLMARSMRNLLASSIAKLAPDGIVLSISAAEAFWRATDDTIDALERAAIGYLLCKGLERANANERRLADEVKTAIFTGLPA